ncbi:MAG: metallophosphoesterase family protein [Promethearchaeota archaeon]
MQELDNGVRKFKFIHAADIHLGYRQYQLNERFRDFNRAFKWLLDEAVQEQVDFILIAGDFFHHGNINPETLLISYNYLSEFKQKTNGKVPVIVIEGNHDSRPYGHLRSWLQVLASMKLIVLLDIKRSDHGSGGSHPSFKFIKYNPKVSKGGYYQIPDTDIYIYGIRYMGYLTRDLLKSIKNAIQTDGFNILMMHFGVRGQLGEKVDGIEENYFIDLQNKVDYFALGHYHKQYTLMTSKAGRNGNEPWLFNPGSLEVTQSLEVDYPRGIFIGEIYEENGRYTFTYRANNNVANRRFIKREYDLTNYLYFKTFQQKVVDDLSIELDKLRPGESLKDLDYRDLSIPMIIINLNGTLEMPPDQFNLDALSDEIKAKFKVLSVHYINSTQKVIGDININTDINLNRSQIEYNILKEIISTDNQLYTERAEDISKMMVNLKKYLIEKSDPRQFLKDLEDWWDENDFSEYLNKRIDLIQTKSKKNKENAQEKNAKVKNKNKNDKEVAPVKDKKGLHSHPFNKISTESGGLIKENNKKLKEEKGLKEKEKTEKKDEKNKERTTKKGVRSKKNQPVTLDFFKK